MQSGQKEFDKIADKGNGTNFWDGILDGEASAARMQAARNLFARKYPHYPETCNDEQIVCDFKGWHDGEFAPLHPPGYDPYARRRTSARRLVSR